RAGRRGGFRRRTKVHPLCRRGRSEVRPRREIPRRQTCRGSRHDCHGSALRAFTTRRRSLAVAAQPDLDILGLRSWCGRPQRTCSQGRRRWSTPLLIPTTRALRRSPFGERRSVHFSRFLGLGLSVLTGLPVGTAPTVPLIICLYVGPQVVAFAAP